MELVSIFGSPPSSNPSSVTVSRAKRKPTKSSSLTSFTNSQLSNEDTNQTSAATKATGLRVRDNPSGGNGGHVQCGRKDVGETAKKKEGVDGVARKESGSGGNAEATPNFQVNPGTKAKADKAALTSKKGTQLDVDDKRGGSSNRSKKAVLMPPSPDRPSHLMKKKSIPIGQPAKPQTSLLGHSVKRKTSIICRSPAMSQDTPGPSKPGTPTQKKDSKQQRREEALVPDSDEEPIPIKRKKTVKRRKVNTVASGNEETRAGVEAGGATAFFENVLAEKAAAELLKRKEAVTRKDANALAFFDELAESEREEREAVKGFDEAIQRVEASSQEAQKEAVEVEPGLSKDDEEYLREFVDEDDPCPYCGSLWPRSPSSHLEKLAAQVWLISTPVPGHPWARRADWTVSQELCAMHEAETRTIPMGLRSGYPKTVDFSALPSRLAEGWVREMTDMFLRNPETSSRCTKLQEEIAKLGRARWSSVAHQGSREVRDRAMPGYYGSLGKYILNVYFHRHLATGRVSHATLPQLDSRDFIEHILVPEVATYLIYQDTHSTRPTATQLEEAERVRCESVEYGRYKFRDDSAEADTVIATVVGLPRGDRMQARQVTISLLQHRHEQPEVIVVSDDEDEQPATPRPRSASLSPLLDMSASQELFLANLDETQLVAPVDKATRPASPIVQDKGESQPTLPASSYDEYGDMEYSENMMKALREAESSVSAR